MSSVPGAQLDARDREWMQAGMSNPSSQDEISPLEPPAVVFARIAEVPLDALDELIEKTQAVYADLNQVKGHPYWGSLVFHQGSLSRALREARAAMEGLRAEATGARNTELGVTVTTAVLGEERNYAHSQGDKDKLVEQVLRTPGEGARHLYVWDRPHDNPEVPGPYQAMRVVVDSDAELGVLNFTEESDEGEIESWQTLNPEPIPDAPLLRFDAGSALRFPRECVLPYKNLRAALLEFTETGQMPEAVQWRPARWADV